MFFFNCHLLPFFIMGISRYSYYYRKGKIRTFKEFRDVEVGDISTFINKVRQNPYFDEFECYLFGSMTYKDKARDLDIFFTGEYLPELLVDLMDYALKVAIMDMGIKLDVFYIPDYSYLTMPPDLDKNTVYSIYSSYDMEMEVVTGELKMFRDYGVVNKDGLFRLTHTNYNQKAIDRGHFKDRIRKLN